MYVFSSLARHSRQDMSFAFRRFAIYLVHIKLAALSHELEQ